MIPRATYRIQFHEDFPFAAAEAIVPYLARLGISHLYASPITQARSGSTHGYDVVDPTCISPALGGEPGFRSLAETLRAHDMGIILDIVPNHMGIGPENRFWQDVLEKGPESPFAGWFDIDWSRHRTHMWLPFLGAPLGQALAQGDIHLVYDSVSDRLSAVAYGETAFPIRPEDRDALLGPDREAAALSAYDPADAEGRKRLADLLDRQHWRLAWWRTGHDMLNWRRFFSITELAGLRIEDPAVFDATHALYFRLYEEGLIDGLRVDHVDGLSDPAGYCRTLRQRLDALAPRRPHADGPAYLIVEKILGAGEALSPDWGIDGTSGYDAMADLSALLHDGAGEGALARHWERLSGRTAVFSVEEHLARRQMLAWEFGAQMDACVEAFVALAATDPQAEGTTPGMLRRALAALLEVFPVYRTYATAEGAPQSDERTRRIARERVEAAPGEMPIIDRVLGWLGGEGGDTAARAEAVRRFQQLSSPIAAKSVEDTAFYRYGRLLSGNDVGSDPHRFALAPDAFHAVIAARARDFPHAMLTTATHDHKRGEDVRARLAVLSEIPDRWIARAESWAEGMGEIAGALDQGDLYMLLQMVVGAWPEELGSADGAGLAAFAERLRAWQQKAVREAKLRSSWTAPDEAYEAALDRAIDHILSPSAAPPLTADIAAFVAEIEPAAMRNSLVQTALRYTLPGVPDLYQGAEFRDLSLVDPDNRRPVDYAARAAALDHPAAIDPAAGGPAKQALVHRLLALRAAEPDLFAKGDYQPLAVTGPHARHILTFARTHEGKALVCAVLLHGASLLDGDGKLIPEGWAETRIILPQGISGGVRDILSDTTPKLEDGWSPHFDPAPVALLQTID